MKFTINPELKRAVGLVTEMLSVPGVSGCEMEIVQFVTSKLRDAGLAGSAIKTDNAHRSSPFGGEVGNLIVKLPGTYRAPRRLLMAHLDTVPLCAGAKPVVRGGRLVSADKNTALGADDRAGAAAVLTAALEILSNDLPHPPLTFLWTIQEEVGLQGARHLAIGQLGRPKLGFNFDGGSPTKLTVGANGTYRMEFRIEGHASHAGVRPEGGVSAIEIASRAIAQLARDGWHGRIRKGKHHGTSNVGVIQAGEAVNVVTDSATVIAEARSHDPQFRKQILDRFRTAFERAAQAVKSEDGRCGRVQLSHRLDYEAYQLDAQEPCVQIAEDAVRAVGAEPVRAVTDGGIDANWLVARGVPTVSLGAGQENAHTTREALNLAGYRLACRIALRLATGDAT